MIGDLQLNGFNEVDAGYFGGVAVAAGNAVQLRKDTWLTLGITSIFLILFISWYFKTKKAPVLILLPVVLGALFSLSMIYWIKGSISVIALAAGSIVLGIAINYSLHVYNHFRHRKDMKAVLEDLAFPLTIGGLTTIGGFLCLQFVQSEILKDLGLFAAFTLIGASISSLVFLPHLIESPKMQQAGAQYRQSGIPGSAGSPGIIRKKTNGWSPIIFLLTIIFAFFVNRVGFDQDMMHMNYMPESLKKSEATLNRINAFSLRSVYLITDGDNLESALRKQESADEKIKRLQQKNIVKKSSGAFHVLISDSLQKERIRYWNEYWSRQERPVLMSEYARAGNGNRIYV